MARRYGQLEEDDEGNAVTSDAQVALGFDGGEVRPSVLGQAEAEEVQAGLRDAGKVGPSDDAPNGVEMVRSGSPSANSRKIDLQASTDDRDREQRELSRLRRENAELHTEVDRLQGVSKDNDELQQVVKQLKQVVVSYGFSELECMNAKPKKGKEGVEQLRYAPRELFMIISMKFAEIAGYYGGAYIYTNYCTEELGFTDQEAGNLYAAYGFMTTLCGIGAGIVIDKLGVRRCLLIGTITSTIARFGTGWTTSKFWCAFISLTFFPIGGAFGLPVLALGIRRYSHKDNRKFAFSIFYTMLMLATLLGTMMINQIRGFFPNGADVWGMHFTWMRLTWMMCTMFTMYTVICAFFLRDIQVIDGEPLEDMKIELWKPIGGDVRKVLWKIVKTPRFLRLTMVSFIFCGVQMGFRHLDATFPKYMMRTYGENAPWEVILSVNPVVTFFCAPMCTAVLIRYKVGFRKALILGAFLSGVGPFFLAVFESYLGAVMWIFVMSVGQAIWGPKLYEYSTMSAPAGREGLFVAITAAPMYFASAPTGIISGWLLESYCPKNGRPEERSGHLLWLWVGLTVVSSPILLWVFRRKLLKKGEDKPPEQTDQSMRVGENQLEVPSAEVEEELVEAPMVFGNAGAAWSGYDMGQGGGLSDDSDEDFDDPPPRESSTPDNTPTRRRGSG